MGKSMSKGSLSIPDEQRIIRKQSCVPTVKFQKLTAPSNGINSNSLNVIGQQNFRCNALQSSPGCEKTSLEFTQFKYEYDPVKLTIDDDTSVHDVDVENGPEKLPLLEQETTLLSPPIQQQRQLNIDDTLHGVKTIPFRADKILFSTPVKPNDKIKVQETFWRGKRKIIPDYMRMFEMDHVAIMTPLSQAKRGQDLVDYLTAEAESDVEKVRVLLRWLATHVEFDQEKGASVQSARNVLMSGRAGVPGFNEAFAYMCSLANLTCEIITGTSKSGDYFPGVRRVGSDPEAFALRHAHAWCRVQLEDRWYNIDPIWVAGSVENGKYTKMWDEQWFLADPESFLSLHLPLEADEDSLKVNQKLLGSCTKYEDISSWESNLSMEPICAGLGIKPISHLKGVIQTKRDAVLIKFECSSQKITFSAGLKHVDGRDYSGINTLTYAVDGGFHVFVLFPAGGRFKLQIKAQFIIEKPEKVLPPAKGGILKRGPTKKAEDEVRVINVASYLLETTGKIRNPTLPNFTIDNRWGLSDECKKAGLQLTTNKGAMLKAKEGRTTLSLILPTAGWCPVTCRFFNTKQADKSHHIYTEKQDQILTVYILCPVPDYYILEVWMRSRPDIKHDLCSRFLVMSYKSAKSLHPLFQDEQPQQIKNPRFPCLPLGVEWGFSQHAIECGISKKGEDSNTVILPNGAGSIELNLEHDTNLTYALYEADCQEETLTRGIYIEVSKKRRIINMRMDKSGLFRLQILGHKPGSNIYEDVANYLLVVKNGWSGSVYPLSKEWGVNEIGASYGLLVQNSRSSTIVGSGTELKLNIQMTETANLMFKVTAEDGTTFTYKAEQDFSEKEEDYLENEEDDKGGDVNTTITIPLSDVPNHSFFMLQIFLNESPINFEDYLLAGTFLIVGDLNVFNLSKEKVINKQPTDFKANIHRGSIFHEMIDFTPHQLTDIFEDE